MTSNYQEKEVDNLKALDKFKRILLQDSTIIRLPLRLFEMFSGVKNASTVVCNARIQGIYDLVSRQFIKFSIDSYKKNDQSVAFDIPVEKGDLVLRDRGYFVIGAMKELKQKGADSIYRYKYKTSLFDIETGKEIQLLKYLKENDSIDKVVSMGSKEKYKVRIVAERVNEETANLRRMRSKKDARVKNPSKELLELMSWTIYITTVTLPELTFEILFNLYGLRWRIENIFKVWKSNFSFTKIHNVSVHQLRVLITARLIMITFINHKLFNIVFQKVRATSMKTLSMMKFMRYISKNLETIGRLIDSNAINGKTLNAIIRFCTYDQRKRVNFETQYKRIVERGIALIIC